MLNFKEKNSFKKMESKKINIVRRNKNFWDIIILKYEGKNKK